MTKNTALPIVHMNGTSLDELIRGYDAIDDAIIKLEHAMLQLEFNARDYYPKGTEYWEQANSEYSAVNACARHISEWVQAHRDHLDSIKMERER